MPMYVKVVDGEVIGEPQNIDRRPSSGSSFPKLSNEDLRAEGWMPVSLVRPDFNREMEKVVGVSVQVGQDSVTYTDIIEPVSDGEVFDLISDAIQEHLDTTAQSRLYDNALSCVSYVADPDPVFKAEALAFSAWRSAVWAKARTDFTNLAEVRAVTPTSAEYIQSLPTIEW